MKKERRSIYYIIIEEIFLRSYGADYILKVDEIRHESDGWQVN